MATAGFGIVVGTAALFFFLSLGIGVRTQLLSHVFPIDKLELEPQTGADPGLLALVLGDTPPPPGIDQESVNQLRSMPEVRHVFPKLRLAFPTSARGGKELIGQDVGSNEMICDGVEPELVASDVANNWEFLDPWDQPGPACTSDDQCDIPKYCERPSGSQQGKCVEPVPVLVSRYLVEFFNKGIAPTHRLPSVGNALLEQANGVVFTMRLGESLLGTAKMGSVRIVRARIVGVSPRAIDLGLTLPIGTVRRWNSEYAGDEANRAYSSVLVETKGSSHVSAVIERADQLGMIPKDRRARDVSLLIDGVTGLLSLVSTVILVMAGANVAYTFRALTL
ncbi:MAG: hypothetical protein FWD57_14885, partial [Polyangiaceae bacterium]|nr:hypothetical protein [Polyangiaceae bacterium]